MIFKNEPFLCEFCRLENDKKIKRKWKSITVNQICQSKDFANGLLTCTNSKKSKYVYGKNYHLL